MKIGFFVRFFALIISLGAVSLSAYGAYEMQLALEKAVNYLVVAAPFVVIAAASMPPIAERLWTIDHKGKTVLLWIAIVPAAILAFFSALERVHYSKESLASEQRAITSLRDRMRDETLVAARAELKDVLAKQEKELGLKACKETCQTKWANQVDAARKRESDVLAEIMDQEKKLVNKPDVTAPIWLLPATLDLLGFVGTFVAFAPNRPAKEEQKSVEKPVKKRPRRKIRRKPRVSNKIKKAVEKPANDNVHYLKPRD